MSVNLAEPQQWAADLESAIQGVVLGKPRVVRMVLVALVAGEHILLEDVPGVGKTLVAKTLARSISGKFSRLQFTPDLLPSDIVGSSIFRSQSGDFLFTQGPIFSNIVLADEINRAPPRTQSALLEAMSDRQVSVDGNTYHLEPPFVVVATQNPYEFEGTYALPESQLDRFLIRISMGYPSRDHERRVLTTHRTGEPVDQLESVLESNQILQMQQAVREVRFDSDCEDYLLDLVEKTRNASTLHVGVSTRGTLSLYRAAQAHAFLDHRDFVVPDDIKSLAVPVLAHRVVCREISSVGQRDVAEKAIEQIVNEVAVP